MTPHTRVPVLIAGGGPVGLTLALELGWRGIRCLLVEPNKHFGGNPKAKTVHQRTLELFRRWGRGVPDKLRAAAPLGAGFPSTILYVTRLTGQLITVFHNATPADGGNLLSPDSKTGGSAGVSEVQNRLRCDRRETSRVGVGRISATRDSFGRDFVGGIPPVLEDSTFSEMV